jgi:hypothetical protein
MWLKAGFEVVGELSETSVVLVQYSPVCMDAKGTGLME